MARSLFPVKPTQPSAAGISAELSIIGYHEIVAPQQALIPEYAITPQQFEQQILWLKNHGYQFVSVDAVLAARAGNKALPPQSSPAKL